jgi:CRP-like cAMP-binding protein
MNRGNGDRPGAFEGPNVAAPDVWNTSGNPGMTLSGTERARLAVISTVMRFGKGDMLYRSGDRAEAIFNLVGGFVKSWRTDNDGSRHVVGFLFPGDLIGLASEGTYVNSAEAITPVTAYRIPVSSLETRLRTNAALEYHVICKLCHDLRETQRHAFLLTRHHALAKTDCSWKCSKTTKLPRRRQSMKFLYR